MQPAPKKTRQQVLREILPVRLRAAHLVENPLQTWMYYYLMASDGEVLMKSTDSTRLRIVQDLLNKFTTNTRAPQYKKVLTTIVLDTGVWETAERIVVKTDTDGFKWLGRNNPMEKGAKALAMEALKGMDIEAYRLPFNRMLELECVFYTRSADKVNLAAALEWVVEFLVDSGILRSSSVVKSFSGSRVVKLKEKDHGPYVEIRVRGIDFGESGKTSVGDASGG